jgi:hypothetical protein
MAYFASKFFSTNHNLFITVFCKSQDKKNVLPKFWSQFEYNVNTFSINQMPIDCILLNLQENLCVILNVLSKNTSL